MHSSQEAILQPADTPAKRIQDPFELQDMFLEPVFRYVSSFVRQEQDAEDVTMEIFQAAFRSFEKLKRVDDPLPWLLGIARRKVADSLRRTIRRRESPLDESLAMESPAASREAIGVHSVLSQLPEEQAQALVLKYAIGLTTAEVAVVLGRSEDAANSLLQRARSRFQDLGAPLFKESNP